MASSELTPLNTEPLGTDSTNDEVYGQGSDTTDDVRLTDATLAVPVVNNIRATIVRAGLVSLQWDAAAGDIYQNHTLGDTVSYYRIYRDGEFFIDTLSPFVEDTSSRAGHVEYAVESHKYIGAPDYTIYRSEQLALSVSVPTFSEEVTSFAGVSLPQNDFDNALVDFKTCTSGSALNSEGQLCTNQFGYAWQQFDDGRSGDLLRNTISANSEFLVSVRNTEADLGIIPGIPTWSVKTFSTGESLERDFILGDGQLSDEEGHVVNGVALGDDSTAFISGTLYQSYLPRNLGIEVGVIPVTNGYFVAQLTLSSGELIQFKRFSLAEAPGVAATVNNGILEMQRVGQVTMFDSSTLTQLSSVKVSGYPVFADDQFVYTRSFNPVAYNRFEKVKD